MGDFFVYILKSSACLAFFYLFYRLLLSRETFHRFNRVALLSVVILSVAIPFIRIITDEPIAIQRPLQNLENLLMMAQMQTEIQVQTSQSVWLPVLFIVYLAGCIFFLGRFLYSTIRICRIIRRGEKQVFSGSIKLVVTGEKVCPFSWLRYIVISQKDMEESGKEILTHEMAHIHARHSFDMVLCTFCVILQWFNPAVWLLKQELQNIHEYEADESVINHGVDAKKYQLLLIKKAVGTQRLTSMANSFNHSKLKKRITMMLKQKSSPWARLKYLYVLPLTAFTVVAFARPEISRELGKISSAKISEILPNKEVIASENAELVVVAPRAPVPQSRLDSMQHQIDSFSEKSKERMQEVKKKAEMSRYLILIDDEVATYDELGKVAPANIYSFSIIQKKNCEEILAKHNASDKEGVILVVKQDAVASDKIIKDDVIVVGSNPIKDLPKDVEVRLRGKLDKKVDTVIVKDDGEGSNQHTMKDLPDEVKVYLRGASGIKAKPLIIIDGVEQTKEDALKDLNAGSITSISVLKDESSVKLYGEKGKNGVILVTTIKASEKKNR